MSGSLSVANGGFRLRYGQAAIENLDKLIAAGTYPLALTYSPKFTRLAQMKARKEGVSESVVSKMVVKMPEIQGVTGRSGLRIHPASFSRQLLGCVAPAMALVDLDKDGTIDGAQSQTAFRLLMDCLWPEGTESTVHSITIRDPRK